MWRHKVQLAAGESLKLKSKRDKGNLGQAEVELYSIVDTQGTETGSVQLTDHTSIKAPFRRSLHLIQRNSVGIVVFEERLAG